MLEGFLLTIHIFANMLWIGSIVSVGFMTAQAGRVLEAGDTAGGRAMAEAATALYRRVATPAFVVSFVFGATRLLQDPKGYMHLHWFHGKLTFALIVIALHHVIGARARAMKNVTKSETGSMQAPKNSAILTIALLACALITVSFPIFLRMVIP